MSSKHYKHVSDIVGEWGPWQRNITLFALSISMFSAFNNLAVSFYAPQINYWCVDNQTSQSQNQSIDEKCAQKCNTWDYDRHIFTLTIIEEFNLICDRNYLASLTHSVYMIGYAVAAFICGVLSDRFGRLRTLWITTIIEIFGGISCAFSVSITHFFISRIILAFGSNGRLLSSFMLVSECVGPKYRANVGMYIQCGWALGYCMLPGIVYALPNFRHFLLATSIPEALWLIWLWYIPESPRWQLTHGEVNKAIGEMTRAVKRNRIILNDIETVVEEFRCDTLREEEIIKKNRKSTVIDLMKTPNLRRSTLIMCFTWFVNSFVYYGIILNIGNLLDFGGNIFLSYFIFGVIEFPSYLFCVLAFKYLGRKPLTAFLMYGSGLGCLGTIPFTSPQSAWRFVIAMFGKFCITSSYGLIYVYAAEIYPTVLRQSGVGACSIAARIGSIIAPFVKDLSEKTSIGFAMSVFGTLSVANGISIHFLPETRGTQIPDTLEDAENLDIKTQRKDSRKNAYSLD